MNVRSTLVILATGILLTTGFASAEDKPSEPAKEGKPQLTCPVMAGEAINRKLFVDTPEGKRIYVCCRGCIKEIQKDPAKWTKVLEDAGVALEIIQTTCPVEGGKIDKKIFADHEGKRVYFCCPDCIGKFKADPKTYIVKLTAAAITLDAAPQEKAK